MLGAGALALDPFFFARAAAAACSATGSYGPLGAADANGIRLPNGFSSRMVARAGARVGPTSYVWPNAPDGGATFALANGGWVYAANSEVAGGRGGASSISFNSSGTVTGARRILGGTSRNCAGGPTPWGTWLSCEEVDRGYAYECGVTGNNAVRRPRLGRFKHEAAAVDGPRRTVYLTEDEADGCFYRFRYTRANDLSSGTLQVARVTNGTVTWATVPDPAASSTRTRHQVSGARTFSGGEGIVYTTGLCTRPFYTTRLVARSEERSPVREFATVNLAFEIQVQIGVIAT